MEMSTGRPSRTSSTRHVGQSHDRQGSRPSESRLPRCSLVGQAVPVSTREPVRRRRLGRVGFHNPVTDSEQGRLRGSFVLVDQPAEDWATSDPLVGQVDDGPVGSWRLPLQRPVWSSAVVVTGIFIERQA